MASTATPDDAAAPAGSLRSTGDRHARRRAGSRLAERIVALTLTEWALIALIAGYTTHFTRLSLEVHHGLGTSAYDFGLYDQGVWLLSRFESPFVTLMGRHLFGDHTSFILLLVVPLYWVAPSAGVLFFAQSFAIAMAAVPVFRFARRRIGNDAAALVMAGVYLLHPAVSWTNRENFHPDSALAVFVAAAIVAATDRRWRTYGVMVALALLVKEDAALVIVPLGLWVALRRDRRAGIITALVAVAAMLTAMFVVMRSLIGVPTRNAWRIPFGGPSGFLRTLVTSPGEVLDHYRSGGRPWYLWQMTFSAGLVFLRAPAVALISAVVLATNMLSTFWYQYQINYHYALVAVPALVMGATHAIGVVAERWRGWLVLATLCTSLWSAWAWGAMPFSRAVIPTWPPSHPVAVAARDILQVIPDDAVVAAQHSLTAHLAHRREIYMFPTPFSAKLYGVGNDLALQRLPAADRVDYVVLTRDLSPDDVLVWEREQAAFDLVAENEWWRVFRRSVPADARLVQSGSP